MYVLKNSEEVYMLKFNLTQEGKTLIDALQGDAKLTITKVLLRGSGFDNNTSKEITSFKGAVCNDGTGNGAYVVIDINDNSNSNYSCNGIELFSDQTKIATQCANEQSGYEVILYCGERGMNTYPSITYRTQTWASKKTPTNIQLSAGMGNGKQCGISMYGGDFADDGTGATFDFENGNFPKTITLANGDVWVTNETVNAAGVTEQADYYASSEMGGTSIRPLFSKVLIQKDSNKQLKLRVSCQFDGAEKCKFNTTSINLPYATRFREGVVRLADPSEVYGKDGQRYNTVYSAADVDAKINQVTSSLGNLDQYAKKAEENTFTENNIFEKNVEVNGIITGSAVATKGLANEKDTLVVSLGYANDKYLSKTDASSTYLTQTNAEDTYLKKTDAEAAANNYAKLNANNEFAAGTTNTFNGDVTVKGIFAVGESQEAAVFMVYGDSVSGTAINSDKLGDMSSNMLPTEGAVVKTIAGAKSELDAKDNDLQTQIDGINAGQNLADIVNNTTELAIYDVSHLKAKGDFQHGSSGAKWAIGDKVQVLGGGDTDAQSCVYELIKGAKPEGETNSIQSTNDTNYYWHYIGVYGTNAYTKAEIDEKVNTINNTLGTKANKSYVDTELGKKANSADVYTKTASDAKFAQLVANNEFKGNNTFNGTISGTAVTSDIATDAVNNGERLTTCAGVSNFVTKVVDDKITELQGEMSYLKLNSDTDQTVNSNVAFNGIISGTAVAEVTQKSEAGSKLLTVDYANEKLAQLASNNNFTGETNTFQEVSATRFSGNGVTSHQMSEEAITQGADKIVSLGFAENRYVRQEDISSADKIGSMGLFLYTGGDLKARGSRVSGTLLQEVGMQLPMDGVVSWSQGAAMGETTWVLLNNTIAGEPCLVLAIRVG